ncbi:MAG: DUF4116 domain-containing protein, partial [Chlamydiae bacterium]|nr:DUF4116 domain-containing protein [Chlamydiota bacterium]
MAVNRNGLALRWVPERKRTDEIYLAAVTQDGMALGYVPEQKRTLTLCTIAIKHSKSPFNLDFVPEKMRTDEICLAAVRQNGNALRHVPEDKITKQIYLAAVSQDIQALKYIREEKRTLPLCIIAIKFFNSPEDWDLIPKTREILEPLYKHDPTKVGKLITTHFNKERKEILTAAMDRFLTKDLLGHVVMDGKKAYIEAAIDYRDPIIGDFLLKEFLAHPKLDLEVAFKLFPKQQKVLLPLFIALTYGIESKQVLSKIKFVKHETTIKLFLSFMKEMDDKKFLQQKKADLFLHVFDEQLERCSEMGKSKTHQIEHMWLKQESKDGVRTIPKEQAKDTIEHNQKILNLRLAMFKMITAENKWKPVQDFSTEAIKDFLLEDLLKNGFIDSSIEGAKDLFLDKFLNFRIPEAIFTYAGHFTKDKEMIGTIKEFISVVMKDTFLDHRHAFNSHKSFLSEEQLAVWEKSTSNSLEDPIVSDLEDQHNVFNRSKPGFKNLSIHDTEDPQDLLLSGTEVSGSCQNIAGNPGLNKCLMGYVLDGKVRVIAIKNAQGKIEARGILKLLVDKDNKPVLFLERIYPFRQFELAIKELAKQKADQMHVPLFVNGQGQALYSKGCIAPYEYEDEVVGYGVTDG